MEGLFPGGNLGDYVAAQNAYFHRPLTAPITAAEPTTAATRRFVGRDATGERRRHERCELRLEWFDTWLKDQRTRHGRPPRPRCTSSRTPQRAGSTPLPGRRPATPSRTTSAAAR